MSLLCTKNLMSDPENSSSKSAKSRILQEKKTDDMDSEVLTVLELVVFAMDAIINWYNLGISRCVCLFVLESKIV